MKQKKSLIIAIDMDGTITTNSFPKIGEPLPKALEAIKDLQAMGHRLVLWTCRERRFLTEAVEFCRRHGIEFVSVNENRLDGHPPLKGRKIFADVYIDDNNLGGFPGWDAVREMILEKQTAGALRTAARINNEVVPSNGHPLQGPHRPQQPDTNREAGGLAQPAKPPAATNNGNGMHTAGVASRPGTSRWGPKPAHHWHRRTRIVATLGPATDPPQVLEAILKAGVDVARINLSHGTAEENCRRVASLRQMARKLGRPVAVLADLPGPKLRAVLRQPLVLRPGQEVRLAAAVGIAAEIQVTEPGPLNNVQPGKLILLDDGRLQLQALRIENQQLVARVIVGGTLLHKKGINLPDTLLGVQALTDQDREALAVAAAARVDWLGLSFVRGPEAAEELRQAARAHGLDVPVLAKIELPEAIERAEEIIAAFDGAMVDRGDLGVEIPMERVPFLQKRLIALARALGKPFITATDMLDSMRTNPRPTRAESNDVANAIYDGTDAVMLSGETAAGKYPVEAVAYMDRIARETEAHLTDYAADVLVPNGHISDRITQLACTLAREVGADVIIAPTHTGNTPRLIARHRPRTLIVAPTPVEAVERKLALVWGVLPVPVAERAHPGEDWLEVAVRAAFAHGAVWEGELAVGVAGHLVDGGKKAPTIRVVRIGEGGSSGAP